MDYSQFLHMPEEASLLAVILILFLADLFMCKEPKEGETISQKSSAINYVAIGLLSIHTLINLLPCCNGSMQATEAFGGMYQHTPMMTVIKSVLNIGTLVVFLMANSWLRRPENIVKQGEFYLVTLFTLLGMYFMISSGHFLMFFIGLELASVPMAALVAYDKYRYESAEAGAKFILLALQRTSCLWSFAHLWCHWYALL